MILKIKHDKQEPRAGNVLDIALALAGDLQLIGVLFARSNANQFDINI